MSQSFIESRRVARIRPRVIRLFLPFLFLAISCFAVSFYNGRLPEQWMDIALYSVAGAIAVILWLIPVLRYLSSYVDVFTTRVLYRAGLMGQRRVEANFSQVTDVRLGDGRRIQLTLNGGEIIELPALPKAKKLVAEIQALVAKV
jgi:membrane protein YdbS with pleckstrin-like domain